MPRVPFLSQSKPLTAAGEQSPGQALSPRQYAMAKLRGSTTFIKFAIVGSIGYVVNQVFLFLLYDSPAFPFLPAKDTDATIVFFTHPDVRLLIATVIAVEVSILSNFFWHNVWTFSDRAQRLPMALRFVTFNLTSIGSPVISVATVNVLTPNFGVNPYAANTLGIALGMIWNWLWNTQVIWRKAERASLRRLDDDQA